MAAKGKKKRAETIFLVCEESGDYNYVVRRKPGGEKLELKKYCPKFASTPSIKKKRNKSRHVAVRSFAALWPNGGGSILTNRSASQRSCAVQIPAVVAQLLVCRGISDPAQARRFLDSKLTDLREPDLLPGCSHAAEQVYDAIGRGRRVVVYGDYDVDGMTGTAILRQCLKLLGANVGYYLPNRTEEGYGLNHEAVRRLASEKANLIVTVDCGIASLDEAITASECGLELIVTDHHELRGQLPQAVAVVHPRLPNCSYPFSGLSGSGVALKLAWALCQRRRRARKVAPAMRDFLIEAVGLAALGTVADVVPLIDENRILVRHGLNSLAKFVRDRPGRPEEDRRSGRQVPSGSRRSGIHSCPSPQRRGPPRAGPARGRVADHRSAGSRRNWPVTWKA